MQRRGVTASATAAATQQSHFDSLGEDGKRAALFAVDSAPTIKITHHHVPASHQAIAVAAAVVATSKTSNDPNVDWVRRRNSMTRMCGRPNQRHTSSATISYIVTVGMGVFLLSTVLLLAIWRHLPVTTSPVLTIQGGSHRIPQALQNVAVHDARPTPVARPTVAAAAVFDSSVTRTTHNQPKSEPNGAAAAAAAAATESRSVTSVDIEPQRRLAPPRPDRTHQDVTGIVSTAQSAMTVAAAVIPKPTTVLEATRSAEVEKTTAAKVVERPLVPSIAASSTNGTSIRSTTATTTAQDVVDLRRLYFELPFDNPDGGVWKQGWDVQPKPFPAASHQNQTWHVIVVPFAQCNPGWRHTLAEDLAESSRILDAVVEVLQKDERRTFVWSEVHLFAQWWNEQEDDTRAVVRQLLRHKQLEFVSGGWTMPDEAVTTADALELQLRLGHDWIRLNLGAEHVPRTAWSLDASSGHSPTMAHLYQTYNITALLLHRVHYAVKKKLAQARQLELVSQQQQQLEMWTHVTPFYGYDIAHTCGPNPDTCCQFDFGRQKGLRRCPRGSQPVVVTDDNVADRAHLLLDQYRRKAALYRSSTLLVPLGGDYRYGTWEEAEMQFDQYQRLFDYMNQHVPGVHVPFGTLSDYFTLAKQTFVGPVPIVKGSFFPYADMDTNYWTGLYTSQASDKLLSRQLERLMRAAESLGATNLDLPLARQTLSLVQNHNVITGAIHEAAMGEYGQRVFDAFTDIENWILFNSSLFGRLEGLVPRDEWKGFRICSQSVAPRRPRIFYCNDTQAWAFNPSSMNQTCGKITVPSGHVANVALPCNVPGPAKNSRTKFVFDATTGLMLQPIQEEWLVWNDLDGGSATLFVPGRQNPYNQTAHKHCISNGGFTVQTEFWKRTVTERFVSESSSATVLDFRFDVLVDSMSQEWLVRFSTNVTNRGYFHTELNGFQYDTHRYRKDMPLQSQIFPMSTLASIQDPQLRFSILSDHSKGVASVQDGSIDVWLDRGLKRDGAGLGKGVPALRSLTQLRLVLERDGYDEGADFDSTPFCRRMSQEVQQPLILLGNLKSFLSPYIVDARKQFVLHKASVDRIEQQALAQKPVHQVGMDIVRNVSSRVHTSDSAVIPFVFMVHKRRDYLKAAMESLMKSDFPRDRVPIIVSHDGHVPAMIDYVEALKQKFTVIQLFHPHACYDNPNTFPGNDPQLNDFYEGDRYRNLRSFEVTCCKHHFTWLLRTVFSSANFTHIDTFLFLEEDYVVSPTIYQGLVNGLNAMHQFADETNGGFLGLSLDPTAAGLFLLPGVVQLDEWVADAFMSGPMTLHRWTFQKLRQHAAYYCGIDGFDEYNWDWSFVHLQNKFLMPHTVLAPSKILAKHIGVEGGMHDHVSYISTQVTGFLGETVRGSVWREPRPLNLPNGNGGWGHPVDQEHCMRLLSVEDR